MKLGKGVDGLSEEKSKSILLGVLPSTKQSHYAVHVQRVGLTLVSYNKRKILIHVFKFY